MSSYRYSIPEELVYKGGDVIIHTGAKNSGVFLVHSAILRKNSHFFNAALSGIWREPVEFIINGVVRKVWEFEMFFDYDTQLPLLKPLQDPIDPHRHVMPENAAADKSFAKQWSTTNDADQFRILLNTHVSSEYADVYVPPRQFSCTDAQPTKHTALKYYPGYIQPSEHEGDQDQREPARLEATGYASTYGPFFDGHTQFLPTFGGTCDEHHDSRFTSYPTHEAARRHLQAMWSMLLRAFYHLTTPQGGRKSLTKTILLIAHTANLANYYGVLDSIRWTLAQMVYQDQPGVWKLIAEQPRFFLVLGYRLRCMDIFIDAVKHLAGRVAFACMLQPHVYRPNAPSDLALADYVPESVINLIEKPAKRLKHTTWTPSIDSTTRWTHLESERDLTDISLALDLDNTARIFNQDPTALARATLTILESHPIYTLLAEFVNGANQTSTCRQCKASTQHPEPVYHSESYTNQLCPRHGHKAMYHAVDYDTNLKTWEVTDDMAKHEDTDWIVRADEFNPDIPSFWVVDDDVVARETVTVEELRLLGVLESFAVRTD